MVSLCGLRFVQGLKAAEKYKVFGRERAIGYVTKYLILVQEISDFCREHHYNALAASSSASPEDLDRKGAEVRPAREGWAGL
jgi:hypothetical protein